MAPAAAPRSSAHLPRLLPALLTHHVCSHTGILTAGLTSSQLKGSFPNVANKCFYEINYHRAHLTWVPEALGHMLCIRGSCLIFATICETESCALGPDLLSLEDRIQVPVTWLLKPGPRFIQPCSNFFCSTGLLPSELCKPFFLSFPSLSYLSSSKEQELNP